MIGQRIKDARITGMSTPGIWLVLAVAILSLAIAVTAIWLVLSQRTTTARLQHTITAARCWDGVLDQAIRTGPQAVPRAVLIREANQCAKLIP